MKGPDEGARCGDRRVTSHIGHDTQSREFTVGDCNEGMADLPLHFDDMKFFSALPVILFEK